MKKLAIAFSLFGFGTFVALTVLAEGDERLMMAVVTVLFYVSALYAMTMEEI